MASAESDTHVYRQAVFWGRVGRRRVRKGGGKGRGKGRRGNLRPYLVERVGEHEVDDGREGEGDDAFDEVSEE